MRAVAAAAAVLVLACALGSSAASPSKLDFNGHYYELVRGTDGFTFNEAVTFANGKTLSVANENLQGHLLTITSQEEQTFVRNLLKNSRSQTGAGALLRSWESSQIGPVPFASADHAGAWPLLFRKGRLDCSP
jgi:hypothetical protein